MKFYSSIFILLLLSSCELINPEEDTPAFIKIDNFDYTDVGTAKIVDAGVYIDNDLQGIYPIPNTIPVLKQGNHSVYIAPGIKENGISASRTNYPFYQWHQEDIRLAL